MLERRKGSPLPPQSPGACGTPVPEAKWTDLGGIRQSHISPAWLSLSISTLAGPPDTEGEKLELSLSP